MELEQTDPVRAGRRRRVLITGAGGQLGRALERAFADDDVLALTRADWDVTGPFPRSASRSELDLVLHTAAWTDVDGAEDDPQGAAAVNVAGTAHAAALKAPLVTFSTDYVFDGRKRSPYVESDGPNPASAYGRTKLHGEAAAGLNAWIVRTSWLFGATGHNFLLTMLRLGAERDEVAVVEDQQGCPTFVGHLAAAVRDPSTRTCRRGSARRGRGRLHVGRFRRGDLRGGGAQLPCAPNHDGELERPAPRPAYSVLRSERVGAPVLPHWRDGLRACLAEMDG